MARPLPALLASALTIAPTAVSAATPAECALHIWVASATGANRSGWLSNLGMAGAAADYERNKDANLRDQVALIESLPATLQARILADAGLTELLEPAKTKLVFESAPLPPASVKRIKGRRSAATEPCYAELIVSRNFYQKSALHGSTLASDFTWKDFRRGRPRIVSDEMRSGLAHFPPERLDQTEQAREDVARAFADNVREFVRKMMKRR